MNEDLRYRRLPELDALTCKALGLVAHIENVVDLVLQSEEPRSAIDAGLNSF